MCGKTFNRRQNCNVHEEMCHGENITKVNCQYCEKNFSSKSAKQLHVKKKHQTELRAGVVLIQNQTQEKDSEENICKVCPVPQKYKSKKTFKEHMLKKHDGRNDVLKFGKNTRYLTDAEVSNQHLKRVVCEICENTFSCQQNMKEHKLTVHEVNDVYKCEHCPRVFRKRVMLNFHKHDAHKTPSFVCPECGKLFKSNLKLARHDQTHRHQSFRKRNPISSLKKSQQYVRAKEEVDRIKKSLFEAPETVRKSMWGSLVKDCPYYYNKIKENPLTEPEVIELIQDNNLVDNQILNICQFLRQKWGNGVITPNIAKKLRRRKTMLDQFFTEIRLDSSTNLHFKTKKGKIISRSVTYCHDLPGLIAYKKLVENIDESKQILNVIGVDDGKGILKIVWNWSLMFDRDLGKKKLMGPKRSIVLAAVSKVKETHHNMKVLMEITNMNEVEYNLSMDLKLINISIGIQSHSSRYPCPYGECWKDERGCWHKGQDRSIRNIREHRSKWMNRSRTKKGNRSNLKSYMNCEYEPLINGDENDPILKTVPPPPLHTILLGPVNHVFKELSRRYPKILKTIHNLRIQRSKYHGRNFEGKKNVEIFIFNINCVTLQVTSAGSS